MKSFALTLAFLVSTLLAHAGSQITGKFTDDHGGRHSLGVNYWIMRGNGTASTFRYVETKPGHIIARNDAKNKYFPGLFSRFDYVKQKDGSIVFCQTVANAATKAAAEKHAPADFRAKDKKGCGGFPFSVLKKEAPAAPASAPEAQEEGGAVSGE
jgi:hypothetical protein